MTRAWTCSGVACSNDVNNIVIIIYHTPTKWTLLLEIFRPFRLSSSPDLTSGCCISEPDVLNTSLWTGLGASGLESVVHHRRAYSVASLCSGLLLNSCLRQLSAVAAFSLQCPLQPTLKSSRRAQRMLAHISTQKGAAQHSVQLSNLQFLQHLLFPEQAEGESVNRSKLKQMSCWIRLIY